jgi:hypothetical protein
MWSKFPRLFGRRSRVYWPHRSRLLRRFSYSPYHRSPRRRGFLVPDYRGSAWSASRLGVAAVVLATCTLAAGEALFGLVGNPTAVVSFADRSVDLVPATSGSDFADVWQDEIVRLRNQRSLVAWTSPHWTTGAAAPGVRNDPDAMPFTPPKADTNVAPKQDAPATVQAKHEPVSKPVDAGGVKTSLRTEPSNPVPAKLAPAVPEPSLASKSGDVQEQPGAVSTAAVSNATTPSEPKAAARRPVRSARSNYDSYARRNQGYAPPFFAPFFMAR